MKRLEEAARERNRAHLLYENFLEERDASKAGEHLWAAINNLLSAFHRIKTGRGIGEHEKITLFGRELMKKIEGLRPEDFSLIEDLHANYYHEFLSEARYKESVEVARRLYEFLDREVGKALEVREQHETIS